MENFYWQKGNEWDDNSKTQKETNTDNMVNIGEYKVCCFCDEKNCSDYIGIDGNWGQNFYCKYKQCKFEVKNSKFEVNKIYRTSALYGGELIIKVIARTDNTILYIYTDDETKTYTRDIILQNGIESIEAWEYHENKCYWYSEEI